MSCSCACRLSHACVERSNRLWHTAHQHMILITAKWTTTVSDQLAIYVIARSSNCLYIVRSLAYRLSHALYTTCLCLFGTDKKCRATWTNNFVNNSDYELLVTLKLLDNRQRFLFGFQQRPVEIDIFGVTFTFRKLNLRTMAGGNNKNKQKQQAKSGKRVSFSQFLSLFAAEITVSNGIYRWDIFRSNIQWYSPR